MLTHTESLGISKPVYSNGKQLAHHIFLETMAAVDVRRALLARIKREGDALVAGGISIPLLHPPRVIAFGKAAQRMAVTFSDILSGQIEAGVVVSLSDPARRLDRFRYFQGGHPYPNAQSFQGAQAALELVSGLTPGDLVVFLVSGGGSAIFEQPLDPEITLADLLEFNRVLVTCGLPIEQINVLRKHLSAVKGGRLATRAHPARQFTIYISDVPEAYPSMVASGPTLPDESRVEQCYSIAEENKLTARFPANIRRRFEQRTLEETPKPGDERFVNSRYFCLLSNHDAVAAAKAAAEKLGFFCEIDAGVWDADFREVADQNLAALDSLARRHPDLSVCLVSGGEVTCPVTGPGMGGRNQAFALYAAQRIDGRRCVVLSAGTDGRDGNSPTSGAVADGQTVSRARALGLDPAQYLVESDSYYFFRSLGDTLDTGFTDNNVRDVRLWLAFGN